MSFLPALFRLGYSVSENPRTISTLSILAALCLSAGAARAAETTPANEFDLTRPEITAPGEKAPRIGAWSLNVDNDLLTGGGRDQDYTGGLALAITGEGTRDWLFGLDRARAGITRLTGLERLFVNQNHVTRHSIEFGFTLFTPSDITIAEPIFNDHPYASLFFVANAAQHVVPEKKLSYQSVLTFGFLGLGLADSVQSGIHSVIGSDEPEGWDNQISDGGEPTARYSFSVAKTLIEGGGPGLTTQFSINSEASIGFTTDASVGFGMRWGRLERPWHTFNPHPAEYISIGNPPDASTKTEKREAYLYAGINLKARLYNAILQGQFRDSEVTYDFDELNPIVAEGWAGFLTELPAGYRFGVFIRARSAEIDVGEARSPVWGGFVVSRSL